MRTRIKICGIRHLKDALKAIECGADAIGLIFVEKSPRCISLSEAGVIAESLPAFITVVGLFMNDDAETVRRTLKSVPLTLLQFHGDETAEFCEQFDMPYVKVLGMNEQSDITAFAKKHRKAKAILLDNEKGGGTGKSFDWSLIPKNLPVPIILAGGLTPENVALAIETVKPYAVDVSSGVESGTAVKDHKKIEQFIKEVQRVG